MFHHDLFEYWDNLQKRMPGASERSFLFGLQDFSVNHGRVRELLGLRFIIHIYVQLTLAACRIEIIISLCHAVLFCSKCIDGVTASTVAFKAAGLGSNPSQCYFK